MLVGVLIGATGWYLATNLKPFVSDTAVTVRTFQATDTQYRDVTARFRTFAEALNAGRAATLSLSADDLNTLIARDPEFQKSRGRLFVDLKDSEIITEASYPIESKSGRSAGTQKLYFNGRAFFSASYSLGEAALHIRKVESLDGKTMTDFLLRLFNQFDAAVYFNQFKNDEARSGSPWAKVLSKVDKIIVEGGHVVITTKDGQPPADPVPLPSATP